MQFESSKESNSETSAKRGESQWGRNSSRASSQGLLVTPIDKHLTKENYEYMIKSVVPRMSMVMDRFLEKLIALNYVFIDFLCFNPWTH